MSLKQKYNYRIITVLQKLTCIYLFIYIGILLHKTDERLFMNGRQKDGSRIHIKESITTV